MRSIDTSNKVTRENLKASRHQCPEPERDWVDLLVTLLLCLILVSGLALLAPFIGYIGTAIFATVGIVALVWKRHCEHKKGE